MLKNSTGEVHREHAFLHNLQLFVQDHTGDTVALHSVPFRAPERGQDENASRSHRATRKVRLF